MGTNFFVPKIGYQSQKQPVLPLPCWKIDHFVTKACFSQFFQCPQHWLLYMNMSIVSSPLQDETFLAVAMILLNVTIISEVVYMIDTSHNICNSVLIARRFYFETLFRFHYLFKIILFIVVFYDSIIVFKFYAKCILCKCIAYFSDNVLYVKGRKSFI